MTSQSKPALKPYAKSSEPAMPAPSLSTKVAAADSALASASPNGSLSGAPAEAIAKSLAMDPKHTKGLWLKASLAHEERRYQEALQTWKTLLTLIPPQSSDARIVEANIAEAKRLAAESKG